MNQNVSGNGNNDRIPAAITPSSVNPLICHSHGIMTQEKSAGISYTAAALTFFMKLRTKTSFNAIADAIREEAYKDS